MHREKNIDFEVRNIILCKYFADIYYRKHNNNYDIFCYAQ